MKLIQLVFVVGIFFTFFVYLSYFRSPLKDRMIAVIFFVASIFTIVFPDYTQQLATILGVGRGVDVYLYLFSLASIFCLVLLYSKIHRLERINTEIIRQVAINAALPPKGPPIR